MAEPRRKKSKAKRGFEMGRYGQRHVVMKLAYLGEAYHGLAIQEEGVDTVEARLRAALLKCRLVCEEEGGLQGASFSRCGRTDAGVSAWANAFSVRVRSSLLPHECSCDSYVPPRLEPHAAPGKAQEIDYVEVLNRLLPADIRVTAWAPVPPSFSARFSCVSRSYRYFFAPSGLDLEPMREAARLLEGSHDFRNFCKPDVLSVQSYVRRVDRISVEPAEHGLLCCYVEGNAFLWHQIRLMMAVLFLVGRGLESPALVTRLLDVQSTPRRPAYLMEAELPLVLARVDYEGVEWRTSPSSLLSLHSHLSSYYERVLIKATLLKGMLDSLGPPPQLRAGKGKPYVPLMERELLKSVPELKAAAQAKQERKKKARQ